MRLPWHRLLASALIFVACHATLATTPSTRAHLKDPMAVAFGTMPAIWGARISPDGSKLVFLQMHPEDLPIAVVYDFTTGRARMVLASEKNRFDIHWCGWANDERLLCGFYTVHQDGFEFYPVTRLVAVNADATDMTVLMQGTLRNTWTQYQDQIVDWLPDDARHVLVERPDRNGSGVAELDVYSGSLQSETRIRASAYQWMTDGHGNLRLRLLLHKTDGVWEYRLAGTSRWRKLHQAGYTDLEDVYDPVGFGDHPNLLLVLKPHEGRIALWSHDLAGDREDEVVFSHPEVDVDGSLKLGKFQRVVAIGYSTDRDHFHFFDKDVEDARARISGAFPGQQAEVVDENWDRRFYLVRISSDRNPGAYYRYDAETNQLKRIASQYPKLDGVALSPMKPIHYQARDGTSIPGYLTMPAPLPEGGLPAIILPHGGPQSRDYWGYDWLTQFFSNRGYAVLQSNYRGSGGFGEIWSGEGGFRNWRLAIDDITDGARYLIEAGIADPNRICIVGWSYGGYAALLSAVEEPSLYRCVVSIAGVTDLPKLIEDSRGFLGWRGMREFIGRDSDTLKMGSPARRAEELRAPVLLLHGDRDINVRFEQSEEMVKALKHEDKQVEFVKYEGVEHGIRRNRYRIDLLARTGAFVDRYTRTQRSAQMAP